MCSNLLLAMQTVLKRKNRNDQGLYNNKNYMDLMALKKRKNMVQKLAQPERNTEVQPTLNIVSFTRLLLEVRFVNSGGKQKLLCRLASFTNAKLDARKCSVIITVMTFAVFLYFSE